METTNIRGVYAVPVTPYHEDGSIDGEAATILARFCIQSGCRGLFLAGSTGDMPQLDTQERIDLVRTVRKAIPDNCEIMIGATGTSTRQIHETLLQAVQAGANHAILTPPPALKFSDRELEAYFTAVADQSPLPLLLYHHVRSASPLSVQTIAKLARHPRIVGLKETGTDHQRFLELLAQTQNEEFTVLQGCERFVPQSLAAGCQATITALAAVWPEQAVAIWNSYETKDAKEQSAQNEIETQICKVFDLMPCNRSSSYFSYTLKRMLVYRGTLSNTHCRMTAFEPDPNYIQELIRFLEELGFPRK